MVLVQDKKLHYNTKALKWTESAIPALIRFTKVNYYCCVENLKSFSLKCIKSIVSGDEAIGDLKFIVFIE